MGVTIHFQLGANAPNVKRILDGCEAKARAAAESGLQVEIRRLSDRRLLIDAGDCETLAFEFMTPAEVEAARGKSGWGYEWAVLTDSGKRELDPGYRIEDFPQNERLYAAAFCKTQFGGAALHVFMAELVRSVASYCFDAEVHDEGDYYGSGNFFDAVNAIGEVGQMIENIGDILRKAGFEGETGYKFEKEGK